MAAQVTRRALVTGDAGFIGRNFTRRLREDGWDVTGFDVKTGTDAREWFPRNSERFDLCVHAAAVVGGRLSIDGDPLGVASNMGIDQSMLSWAARTQTPTLYFSSSAAYPVALQKRGIRRSLTEYDLSFGLGAVGMPDATYGWSKVTGELLVNHARTLGARVTVVRPFSGYGTDQDLDYPFPAFIARARAGADPFDVWGDGEQVRDFIHVDDVYDASMKLVGNDVPGPVNLGTGIPTSFKALATLVTREAGYAPAIRTLGGMPTGVAYRVADTARLSVYHRPRVTLAEGVRRALAGVA